MRLRGPLGRRVARQPRRRGRRRFDFWQVEHRRPGWLYGVDLNVSAVRAAFAWRPSLEVSKGSETDVESSILGCIYSGTVQEMPWRE